MKAKRLSAVLVCAAVCAVADTDYPIETAVQNGNRRQVEAFRKDAYWKTAPFAVAAVEPMSGICRTPDLFPEDGDFTNAVKVIAARGEYENGSFLMFGFDDLKDVMLTCGDLAGKGGRIPGTAADIKVVKVWYQQGTAWGAYQSDVLRRVPTPELMLHDDTLVNVDHQTKDNYVRCDYGARSAYQCISLVGAAVDHSGIEEPRNTWIHDADHLQPFSLQKHAFKQIIFTLHVPSSASPGVYRGAIAASVGGRRVADIPVALRVLPFELPKPAVFRDPGREFLVSCYISHMDICDAPKAVKNMAAHNLLNPLLRGYTRPSEAERLYQALSGGGMNTNLLLCALPGSGVTTSYPVQESNLNYQRYLAAVNAASNSMAALRGRFGEGVIATSYAIDEAQPPTVRAERATWEAFQRIGGKITASTGYHPYLLFNLDIANIPRQPRASRKIGADAMHDANPDFVASWYGDPHSGPENPDYTRRLYGWGTWRNNYDMTCQYILFRDNWADFWVSGEPFLRGLMICYPQDRDIIDTLAWEGFRESVDDIRYGTLLKQLCARAMASKDIGTAYAGRAASAWIAQVDFQRSALNYLRLETIRRILDLQKRLAREGA